jgi:hypothetical protein
VFDNALGEFALHPRPPAQTNAANGRLSGVSGNWLLLGGESGEATGYWNLKAFQTCVRGGAERKIKWRANLPLRVFLNTARRRIYVAPRLPPAKFRVSNRSPFRLSQFYAMCLSIKS